MIVVILLFTVAQVMAESNSIVAAKSVIKEATIYGDVAEVRREFEVDIKGGFSTISLDGFPSNMDETSVRLSGHGEVNFFGITVTTKEVPREDITSFRLVYSKLNEINDYFDSLKAEGKLEVAKFENQLKSMELFVTSSLTNTKDSISEENVKSLLDIQDKAFSRIKSQMISVSSKTESISKILSVITKLNDDMNKYGIFEPSKLSEILRSCPENVPACKLSFPDETISWPLKQVEKVINFHVHAEDNDKVHKCKFNLAYIIGRASWRSEYDIRLVGDGNKKRKYNIFIDYYASIEQSTNEDWNDIALSLSSSSPSHTSYHPSPSRHHVEFQQPHHDHMLQRSQRSSTKESGNMALLKSMVMVDAPQNNNDVESYGYSGDMSPVYVATATVSSSGDLGASYQFQLPFPVNIPSNPTPLLSQNPLPYDPNNQLLPENLNQGKSNQKSKHRFLISSLSIDAIAYTYIVPTSGFPPLLRLSGKYNEVTPLLPSTQARVFIQDSYIGTTQLPELHQNSDLNINLSPDKKVTSSIRHVLPQYRGQPDDSSNWFVFEKKRYRVKQEEYLFSIGNLHETSTLVLLYENYPKSTEEDIKIELQSPRPSEFIELKNLASDEECIAAVLSTLTKGNEVDPSLKIFSCSFLNNIIWAKWMLPREKLAVSLKYKVLWPEDKNVIVT